MDSIELAAAPALAAVRRDGYAFVPAATVRAWLDAPRALGDWPAFAASWNDLAVDEYLADRGRYRRRRYAVYTLGADAGFSREPHQPHHQALEYNPLFGGVERWFEPIDAALGSGPSLRAILELTRRAFGVLAPDARRWRAEVHQFRIEARPGLPGQPTPEGSHRDGVDYVLVLMIARHNIASGTTTIHDREQRLLGSFTLTEPFDAALVDDARVFHGVTPVEPVDASQPAHRDVLVVTLRREA
jgi:hypothetical protein